MMPPQSRKSTPVFGVDSRPAAIRNAHATKAGVWGLVHGLEGSADPVVRVAPGAPAPPEAVHPVERAGPMRMQAEFYCEKPLGPASRAP